MRLKSHMRHDVCHVKKKETNENQGTRHVKEDAIVEIDLSNPNPGCLIGTSDEQPESTSRNLASKL